MTFYAIQFVFECKQIQAFGTSNNQSTVHHVLTTVSAYRHSKVFSLSKLAISSPTH